MLDDLKNAKAASYDLALLDDAQRNTVLQALADKLRANISLIETENAKDLAKMSQDNPMYDRLLLNESRINAIATDIESVIVLESPLGKKIDERVRPNGLRIEKIAVPLGVVAVIYESRPNVTIDVFTLCFKTGNACVLKGGKEADHSNRVLVSLVQDVLAAQDIDPRILFLLPPDRAATNDVLNAVGLVDVCIPRGSQSLIDFVRSNAKVPVIETGAGIVHAYFDVSGDLEKGRAIVNNSKTRRVSVCNALDNLVIHRSRLGDLYALIEPLRDSNVEIFADKESYDVLEGRYPFLQLTDHFGEEFLSYKMSIKTVGDIEEAVKHIMSHTSGHSEAIIAKDRKTINYFLARIDAAAVYVNASTAFTDGAQFGMGAEIGISTQKLHARGPMGLDALTSYKWLVFGDGQIRG